MKKILSTILLIISLNSYSQTGPNSNFETWVTTNQGNASFEEPTGNWWGSLNRLSFLSCPVTLTKTNEAHSGNWAVKLETKAWGTSMIITGLLAAGYFDVNAPIGQNLRQGKPFNSRASNFKGFYKYTSINNDSAAIFSCLTRYNLLAGKRDTIAIAVTVIKSTITTYQAFNIPYLYSDSLAVPDSIFIVFSSSMNGQAFQGQPGTTLWVDDISIDLQQGIELPFMDETKINITKDFICFKSENIFQCGKIISISGQNLESFKIGEPNTVINISKLIPGLYILNLSNSCNQYYYKFVKH